MSKKSIEVYDNVDHKSYIRFMFLTAGNKMLADEIRWLKKFNYLPETCVCCGKKVNQFSAICYQCSFTKTKDNLKNIKNKNEVEEVKKYLIKNGINYI